MIPEVIELLNECHEAFPNYSDNQIIELMKINCLMEIGLYLSGIEDQLAEIEGWGDPINRQLYDIFTCL